MDAVPTGGVQADAAAPLGRFPVEGLLPCSIQVPYFSAGQFGHLKKTCNFFFNHLTRSLTAE